MNIPENIILCGFMGTGKTTVARLLAGKLQWRFVDTDRLIEERQGRTIREMFEQEGEPFFRQLETDLCREIASWSNTVIATGGGIVINSANRDALENAGLVVCLDAPADVIAARLGRDTKRPLLQVTDHTERIRRIADLQASRVEAYKALTNHLNTTLKTPEMVAEEILGWWRQYLAYDAD